MFVQHPVCLVTGGATRLGRTIVIHLLEQGCWVVVHYCSSQNAAEELLALSKKKSWHLSLVQADLCQEKEIEHVVETINDKYGRLDYLVNSAALFYRTPLSTLTTENAERLWQLNTMAPLLLIQKLQSLLEASEGSVVNILDSHSETKAWKNYSAYAASKAGLSAITTSLAKELAPKIRINAVGPGAISFGEEDIIQQTKLLAKIPMQRWGRAEEIAETVWFLLTGPKYITGQIIIVDGGWSCNS